MSKNTELIVIIDTITKINGIIGDVNPELSKLSIGSDGYDNRIFYEGEEIQSYYDEDDDEGSITDSLISNMTNKYNDLGRALHILKESNHE